jgi:DNA gyrase/topoisomerase IV subunit A
MGFEMRNVHIRRLQHKVRSLEKILEESKTKQSLKSHSSHTGNPEQCVALYSNLVKWQKKAQLSKSQLHDALSEIATLKESIAKQTNTETLNVADVLRTAEAKIRDLQREKDQIMAQLRLSRRTAKQQLLDITKQSQELQELRKHSSELKNEHIKAKKRESMLRKHLMEEKERYHDLQRKESEIDHPAPSGVLDYIADQNEQGRRAQEGEEWEDLQLNYQQSIALNVFYEEELKKMGLDLESMRKKFEKTVCPEAAEI